MLVTTELIHAAKLARRMTTDAFDSEVERLLKAAIQDLGCAGVVLPEEATELAVQACITYFLCNFGDPDRYDDLKKSYDEQKAQLRTRTGYTIWHGSDDSSEGGGSGTAGTFDILADGLTVSTPAADILAAYDAGKTLQLVLGGMTMTATATGMSGGVLTADFRDDTALYKVTTAGEAVTLVNNTIRTSADDVVYFDIHITDATIHANITEKPSAIIAAYKAGNALRLIEDGCVMYAVNHQLTNDVLIVSFYTFSRIYRLKATLTESYEEIELTTGRPETVSNSRSVWVQRDDFPVIG